jgi:hypothetical protein
MHPSKYVQAVPPAEESWAPRFRNVRRALFTLSIVAWFIGVALAHAATPPSKPRIEPPAPRSLPSSFRTLPAAPVARLAWCDTPWTIEPNARLALMLTRTVIHEAGLASPADADGIVFVILDRARKMDVTPLNALRAYAPGVFASRRRDSSGWKVRVTPDATRPEGWRSQARWDEIGAPGVRMVYARVHGLLTGRIEPVCRPHHWGAPSLRREYAGWREIPCVVDGRPALNAYWNVPTSRRRR